MRLQHYILVWLTVTVSLVFLLPEPSKAAQGEPVVRVLLLDRQETVNIQGSMEITGLSAPMIIQGEKRFARGDVQGPVHIVADSGFLSVNGLPYRGEIWILSKADGLMVINQVEMESYLFGVVSCEVNPEWPFEMLKAQAVAARCFALVQTETKVSQDYDLYSDTRSQVYRGKSAEHPRTNEAVKQTRGMVALYQGQVIQAVFSAASGGKTANSEDVWGKAFPYLRSVPDYDALSPYAEWECVITAETLQSILRSNGVELGSLKNMVQIERDSSERVKTVRIVGEEGEAVIPGTKFRTMFNLKSTNFRIVNANWPVPQGTAGPEGAAVLPTAQDAPADWDGDASPKTDTVSAEKGLELASAIAGSISVYAFGERIKSVEQIAAHADSSSDSPFGQTGGGNGSADIPAGLVEADGSGSADVPTGLAEADGSGSADIPAGSAETDRSLTEWILTSLPLTELDIVGSGFGHGVGMSQWGAREMADAGSTYQQILAYYYQGIEIIRLY